ETALSFLSWLVLGAEWKMIGLNGKRFGQIIRKILPGHLQQEYGSRLSPAQRDRLRAKLLQKELREIYV
ncbi:MAG TPA: ATP--guanido phosphotransferase, partial [bacterium]|nr:ATP--guanido phosphotransferase [bacterium]